MTEKVKNKTSFRRTDTIINKLSEAKSQQILLSIIALLFLAAVYLLNRLYPLQAEDWDYSFIWTVGGESPHRVTGLSDIAVSQYNHYMHWGGRSVTHAIDQFLLMIGSGWHDVLNSLAFVLFVYVIYVIINKNNKTSALTFLFVIMALWFCLPNLPLTTLWLTYSANYLWGTLIITAFIYPFYSYYRTQKSKDTILKQVSMLLFGVVAGWTNENMSVALLFFLIGLIALLKYQKIPVPKWILFGLAGAVIGSCFLILAPGNYVRIESTGLVFDDKVFLIKRRILIMKKNYIDNLLILPIIYALMIFLFAKVSKSKDKSKTILISLLFFISAHVGIAAMLASPEFPPRTLFGVVVFMIIGIGILYADIHWKNIVYKITQAALVCFLLVHFYIDYSDKYSYTSYLHDFWHQREIYVEEEKKKGVEDIVFKDRMIWHYNGFVLFDLSGDPNHWLNKAYARYYGIRTVREG